MRKKVLLIGIILVFVLVLSMQSMVFAKITALDTIAEKFNNSDLVASYGTVFECEYTAEVNENVLTVLIAKGEIGDSVDFVLEGSVLTCEELTDETVFIAGFLADCIGQINGEYEDGELFQNFSLFADDISNYTVEEEGFEIIEGEETYTAKMDIAKTVPLIDLSEFYLKPEDFDIVQEIIENESCGNQSGRNVRLAYDVTIGEDEDQIWIGEVDDITESTYKSILSALEVMYGEDAVAWFQEIYPDFSEGNCIYNGFSIYVDEEIDFEEHPMFSGTHVVTITLNKQYMKLKFLRTEYIGEIVDKGNKTITIDFTKDKSYEIGYFDSVKSSDVAFFFKYILTPLASEIEELPEDRTIYFNVVNGKVVLGNKENSVIKVVLGDKSLTIFPTKTDVIKTMVTAKCEEVKAAEYRSYDELEEQGEDVNVIDFFEEMFRYLKYDVTVNITYGEKAEITVYKTLNGENQTVDKTKKQAFTFRFDIEYEKFKASGKVYMDGKLVDSSRYTSKEGSTIITFNDDYSQDLTEGEHTLKVAVADGEVTTTFKVEKSEEKEITKTRNPSTGDNIVVYIALLTISFVGFVFIKIKNKK